MAKQETSDNHKNLPWQDLKKLFAKASKDPDQKPHKLTLPHSDRPGFYNHWHTVYSISPYKSNLKK